MKPFLSPELLAESKYQQILHDALSGGNHLMAKIFFLAVFGAVCIAVIVAGFRRNASRYDARNRSRQAHAAGGFAAFDGVMRPPAKPDVLTDEELRSAQRCTEIEGDGMPPHGGANVKRFKQGRK